MRVELPMPSNGTVGDLMAATNTTGCTGRICYFGPFAFIEGALISSEHEYRCRFDREMRKEIASQLYKNQRRKAIFCSHRVFEMMRPCAEFVDRQHPDCERSIMALFYTLILISAVLFFQWLDQFVS